MKYPFTGLYYYCLYLGNALLKQVDPTNEKLIFYLRENTKGVFGAHANHWLQNGLHKIFLPSLKTLQVWHATYQATNYYPYRKNIPVLLTVHDLNFMHDENKSQHKKTKYLDSLKRKIERAQHIVAISEFTLRELNTYIGLSGKSHEVIYNGCNFQKETVSSLAPAITPPCPFLFTIGTITEKKNFHVLPSMLAGTDYWLIIAGVTNDPQYKSRILREAEKWNVTDRIIFAGSVSEPEKQWYFQHCKAFVFPSLAEGFGLPVLEAMFYQKPTFLSKCGALPEIGGNAAYYFTDFDGEAMQLVLQEGLLHYQEEPQVRERMYKHAMSFNWERAAQKYLQAYRQLAML